ncbi:MAG: InlB B-repeat-containing protein, partial [Alphaproteobacteria bacterium]|nr:InlB B-repeat-containing protein [Alphaproteobacteria bacterium]
MVGEPVDSMFTQTFAGCTGIGGKIPSNMFENISGNPADSMFSSTFSDTGITEVPSDLFAKISGAPAEFMFFGTFSYCINLTTVPVDLFSNISGTEQHQMFLGVFQGTNVSSFTFEDGSSVPYVPVEFWKNIDDNPDLTEAFYVAFRNSDLATTCPVGTQQADVFYAEDIAPQVVCEPAEYTVTYDCNGGDGGDETTATYNKTFTASTTICSLDGYTFNGWKFEDGTNVPNSFTWTYTEDKTLVAQWKVNGRPAPAAGSVDMLVTLYNNTGDTFDTGTWLPNYDSFVTATTNLEHLESNTMADIWAALYDKNPEIFKENPGAALRCQLITHADLADTGSSATDLLTAACGADGESLPGWCHRNILNAFTIAFNEDTQEHCYLANGTRFPCTEFTLDALVDRYTSYCEYK